MAENTQENTMDSTENVAAESHEEVVAAPSKPKRRRRSPKKTDEGGDQAQDAPKGEGEKPESSETAGAPAEEGMAHAADEQKESEGTSGQEQQGSGRKRRRQNNSNSQNQGQNQGRQKNGSNRNQNANGRRRNRRQNQAESAAEPTLKREELEKLKVAELRSKAAELSVDHAGMRKAELVDAIYQAAAVAEGFRPIEGILDIQSDGYGFIRTGNYMKGDGDAFVHQQLIRQYALRPGDKIVGTMSPARSGNKYPPLGKIETINGLLPDEVRKRPRFRDLTPIYPDERLLMEHGRDSITGRAIDLVAPIGKGQRGLIVSPPKAGKTTVLKRICQSIAANNPEVHLFCLLVDERPEEVTDMERSVRGEVVASTFDMPADNHTAVAELVIERAKRLVELGEDVVVVLDSITRLARAYNLAQPASGRILSGGVDSAALYPPKRFLGAARNIEGGGSLTILASALIDTGSKMDEVIFEEFKGTGNMELKLDRDLADKRIFPAIDPVASGTRNEELLIAPDLQPFVWGIRRVLANMNNTERAASALVKGLKQTSDNQEFLIRSARKAQQMDYQ